MRNEDLIQICIREVPASILAQFCPLLKESKDGVIKNIQKNRQPHPLDVLPYSY